MNSRKKWPHPLEQPTDSAESAINLEDRAPNPREQHYSERLQRCDTGEDTSTGARSRIDSIRETGAMASSSNLNTFYLGFGEFTVEDLDNNGEEEARS